jgi:rare lipoprotein A (peptidoglycan hydrolase)
MKRILARARTARKAFLGVVLTLVFANYCYAQELTASFYSVKSLKQEGTYAYSKGIMANGKLFRDELACCACNSYPLGTHLRVTNLGNGKSVLVVVADRTAKRFKGKRIDLSRSAFIALVGNERALEKGLIKVSVEEVRL